MTGVSGLWRVAPLLLIVAACVTPAEKHDTQVLQHAQEASSQVLSKEPINCASSSQECVLALENHGAACLKMSEASSPQDRAANRQCALNDFNAARKQMPQNAPDDMRLRATVGLADALVIDRDNAMDMTRRADDEAKLAALVNELRAMPGGAPYSAYFDANTALNRVLTGAVPAASACSVLAGARSNLNGVAASGDLAQRVGQLRGQIDAAMRPPLRSCA